MPHDPPSGSSKTDSTDSTPPGTPLTTGELATEFGCSTQAISGQLRRLVDEGYLETKSVDGDSRIWWRPVASGKGAQRAPLTGEKVNTAETTFHADGEMADRIRGFDWAETSLGPIRDWPPELRIAVDIVLGAEEAIGLYWGDDLVLLYNDSARAQLGAKHPDALGRPAREVFAEAWETLGPMHEQVLAGDGPVRVEDQYLPLKRDGELEDIWWDSSFTPIPLGDGSVGGVLNISFDITERKRQQQELERQRERLERHSRRLEEFTTTVTHDLRSPLAVISGRLQLYRETGEAEHLDAAEATVLRAGRLVDDLLTVAYQGRLVDATRPTDLGAVFEQAREGTLPPTARWEYDLVPTLLADRDRLLQLFENVLRNSVEHAGDDVTVRVGPLSDGSGFYVEDDGPGFTTVIPERVFEFGYSGRDAGTGFGLSIVQSIVDAHGWDISVGAEASGGVRFEVRGVEFVAES